MGIVRDLFYAKKMSAGQNLPAPSSAVFLKRKFLANNMGGEKTYSGPVVSFIGRANTEILALTAAITPVQDLHGYDHPWPAGGGKNKLPISTKDSETGTVAFTNNNDGSWVVNGSSGGSSKYAPGSLKCISLGVLSEGNYVASLQHTDGQLSSTLGIRIGEGSDATYLSSGVGSCTFTADGTSEYWFTFMLPSNRTADNERVWLQVEAGSSATAYAPYANICPISGRTGLNVYKTGKNLFIKATSITNNGVTFTVNSDGSISLSGTASATAFFIAFQNVLFKAGTYTLHKSDNANIQITLRNATAAGANIVSVSTSNSIFSLSQDTLCAGVIRVASGTVTTGITLYPMMELGSTATAYEPYQGMTYPVTWQTEAGTVYGGTVDVTTGVLTVDRAMVDLGAKTWHTATAVGHTRFWATITGIAQIPLPNIVAPMLCSNYPTKTANQTYAGTTGVSLQHNSANIYIYDPQKEELSDSDFKTAMNGVQLVYELATPVTYQLTPQTVTALVGQNYVWADTGDVTVTVKL